MLSWHFRLFSGHSLFLHSKASPSSLLENISILICCWFILTFHSLSRGKNLEKSEERAKLRIFQVFLQILCKSGKNIQFLSISNKFASFIKSCYIKIVVQEKFLMVIYEQTKMKLKFCECSNIVLTFLVVIPILCNSMQLQSITNIL